MNVTRIGYSVLLTLLCFIAEAQDAVFSQFYNSTLYLNPALAGIEDDLTFSTNHRTQWSALLFPYTTTQASLIVPFHENKHAKPYGHRGGLGLSVYTDVAGQNNNFKTTGVNGNFAYNLHLDKHHEHVVSMGLQIGFIQKRVDTSTLQWGSQYDPFIGFNADIAPNEVLEFQNRAFMDIGSGAFWWYNPLPEKNSFILSINSGLSASHMNNPDESMLDNEKNRLPLLYKYHGGILFRLGHNVTGSLNALVAFQNRTAQGNFGTYLSYRFFSTSSQTFAESIVRLGGWYRVKDAAILLAEFETTKFKLGFSYDMNTSSLRYQNRGVSTYELFFGFRVTSHAPPKSRY